MNPTAAPTTAAAERAKPAASAVDYRRAVLDKSLATETEIQECERILDERRKANPNLTLIHILLEKGFVTKSQLQRLRSDAKSDSNDSARGAMSVPTQIPGYQVISKLGQGAMAVVYKAKQVALDRVVAVKVLPKRLSANTEFVERFHKEGRAAARLNHPNIVQAIDVGVEPGGYHYFVMEFVEGVTVFDELEKNGPYDEAEALRIAIQVGKALEHAHARGFIHRDVKPKNVMVTPDRQAKLADMGLARQADDTDAARQEKGRAYGTPYYIAPEQIRGEEDIDFRADIYSLGATFYHMVTGRVPFDGATPTEVMRKHLKAPLVPPDHIMRNLSAGISEVIEVMMAKRRDDRYASTSDLLADLEAIAAGNPPLQARQMFHAEDLSALAGSDEPLNEHQASIHVLQAEFNMKIAGMKKVQLILFIVIGVLVLMNLFWIVRAIVG
jgi:serine/threonine-protein kinase